MGKKSYCLVALLLAVCVMTVASVSVTSIASAHSDVVEWKYSTDTSLPSSSTTVANGTVYFVGGNRTGRDLSLYDTSVTVYALNAETGAEEWRFDVGKVNQGRLPTVDYISVYKGAVYVHGMNGVSYAIDADTGHEIWSAEVSDGHGFTTTAANGTVYIGGSDGIYARDAKTGEQRWNRTSTGWRSITVSGDTVYAGDDRNFYALNSSTGEQRWNFTFGRSTLLTSVSSDTVYVKSARLYALNAKTGEKKWDFDPKGIDGAEGFSPTLFDGKVYVNGEAVYALDADTGEVQWEHKPDISGITASLTVLDGTVYTGYPHSDTDVPHVIALDGKTGELEWEVITGKNMKPGESPAFADDSLYVGTGLGMNGTIYALDVSALKKGQKTSHNLQQTEGEQDMNGFGFLLGVFALLCAVFLLRGENRTGSDRS